jgi:hypothetical protein
MTFINADRFGAADSFERPLLQDPQQLRLHRCRDVADFVEKMVPPSASSNRPRR